MSEHRTLETEALFAVLADDEEALNRILGGMMPHELANLASAARYLSDSAIDIRQKMRDSAARAASGERGPNP